MSQRELNLVCAAALFLIAGCVPEREGAPSAGLYGALTNELPKGIARAWPAPSATQPWTNGELSVIQTELSPATLFHCKARTLSFFANMAETGIGGPTFAAIETEQGPKIFKPGERIEPARMRESWFVVWWAGASGWTNWDSPWFLTLQHRPAKIRFDANGLHFTFNGEAGYAALMPMYGYYKPLQAGQESSPFVQLKETKKRVLTWEWFKALPADPLARARYWASALREFPVFCEDSFSLDRAHDSVTIRQSLRWVSWNDDWNTDHLKLAPLSPVLALAYKESFPADFSKKPFDMEIFTPFGPYYGIEKVDSYDVTLPVLSYVHETEGTDAAALAESNAPCFALWQKAHGSGDWESARRQWPALRDEFLRSATTHWPAFASANNVSALEQTANALGAARVAYRLGDADTYAKASHVFARAITQLSAQQHGLNYFREQQPWRSMEPIGADAALTMMTVNGWHIDKPAPLSSLVSLPDVARIWRAVMPPARERSPNQPTAKLQRLIPGGPPTPFIFGGEPEGSGHVSFLVQSVVTESRDQKSGERAPAWPRITWRDWKTPTGAPWNFGQVTVSTNAPVKAETTALNGNTRVIVYR